MSTSTITKLICWNRISEDFRQSLEEEKGYVSTTMNFSSNRNPWLILKMITNLAIQKNTAKIGRNFDKQLSGINHWVRRIIWWPKTVVTCSIMNHCTVIKRTNNKWITLSQFTQVVSLLFWFTSTHTRTPKLTAKIKVLFDLIINNYICVWSFLSTDCSNGRYHGKH